MMIQRPIATTILFLVCVATLACSEPNASTTGDAPPTPAMPSHWNVISDIDFGPVDIRPVSVSLGANVKALRNTTYDISGKRIKLNTIVATTPEDADSIMMAIGKMKPEEWFVRRGLLIYEFVGSNDVIPEMRKGRELLAQH